jgi:hypothetical protein
MGPSLQQPTEDIKAIPWEVIQLINNSQSLFVELKTWHEQELNILL